jgi:hypothetical protein
MRSQMCECLFVSASALQDLDLVAVRIGNEKEARDAVSCRGEVDQFARGKPFGFEAGVFGVEILDGDGQVAIAVAEVIGLGAPLVHREFELEFGFGIGEIDEGEIGKVQSLGDLEPECFPVEFDLACFVEHADHAVNGFCQKGPPGFSV